MDALIVSDVHCDGPDSATQHAFLALLERTRPTTIVLAGDIFHAFALPRGEPFVAYRPVLDLLRARDCVALPGNHDWRLPEALGAPAARIGTEIRRKLGRFDAVVTHGDEVDHSVGYRALHALLRGRAFGALLDALGPARAWTLVHQLAGPLGAGRPNPRLVAAQRALAARRIAGGASLVVMGHTHAPELSRIGEGWFLNPGDWVTHRTYGVVAGGSIHLMCWHGADGPSERVLSTDP